MGLQPESWRTDNFKECFCLQSRCDIGASGRNCDFSLWDQRLDVRKEELEKVTRLRSYVPVPDGLTTPYWTVWGIHKSRTCVSLLCLAPGGVLFFGVCALLSPGTVNAQINECRL